MKPDDAGLPGKLRMLQAAAFLSTFDRFTIAPMLVTIAADLQVSLAEISAAASLYFLLYGCMQPVWGMLSDRLGRVRVIRLALIGALVPGLLSAFAPNLAVLVVARAFTGGLFAAVIPASLVYIGDTVPKDARQKALTAVCASIDPLSCRVDWELPRSSWIIASGSGDQLLRTPLSVTSSARAPWPRRSPLPGRAPRHTWTCGGSPSRRRSWRRPSWGSRSRGCPSRSGRTRRPGHSPGSGVS